MSIKNQKDILDKLGIEKLNPMQEEAKATIHSSSETLLLSPTGTGKTLAFLLPIISELDSKCSEVQAMIIVPTRELAIQINQVIREMGSGFKTNAIYGGGQSFSKDKVELAHRPAILVGTPGRVSDHLRRETFPNYHIKTLVLDEFDKSLEIGFEAEMNDIMSSLSYLHKKILTSATQEVEIPSFVELKDPVTINYLQEGGSNLRIRQITSPSKDKLGILVDTICHIGNAPGIIFCNFKDTIQQVSDVLRVSGISHGCFYGGMEQDEREEALIKFRNGTHQILIATDLAARGIDIPVIKFIIHYQLPYREYEFIHRNGRTARMFNDGTAYILKADAERLPEFIVQPEIEELIEAPIPESSEWSTLYISGGRKHKISKGDIAGLFCKQGKLRGDQIGMIELKPEGAFIAVHTSKVNNLITLVDETKLKSKKIRITLL